MNKTLRLAIGFPLIIIAIISLYILLTSAESNEFKSEIENLRVEKDVWFSNDFASPFVMTNTPFHRLNYFSPKQNFRINAVFSKNKNSDSISLVTNLGEVQSYLIYGEAAFTINGEACKLQLLSTERGNDLFIPFIDATSGHSTYGAGRYLEASIPTNNEIILDFNMAYSPYCAYVDSYSCPFPPKSNHLKVAIEAGEKNYHQ